MVAIARASFITGYACALDTSAYREDGGALPIAPGYRLAMPRGRAIKNSYSVCNFYKFLETPFAPASQDLNYAHRHYKNGLRRSGT